MTRNISVILAAILLTGCWSKQDETPDYERINKYVRSYMDKNYVWRDDIPKNEKPTAENPKDYFPRLLHANDDWSLITDDYDSFINSVQGSGKTFGWSLIRDKQSTSDTFGNAIYHIIVHHVHPNTPAANANPAIMRGNVITKLNGSPITDRNMGELVGDGTIRVTVCRKENGQLVDPREVSLTAVKMVLDPIVHKAIIDEGTYRIGYMYYSQFSLDMSDNGATSLRNLSNAISYFSSAGVTDFILDLRTNGGGYAYASAYLCSLIAPQRYVKSEAVFCYDNYAYGKVEVTRFFKDVNVNLYPSDPFKPTVYILTNRYSASASEMTLIGLMPYMNVVQVGETTAGKFYGGLPINIGLKMLEARFTNWGLYTMNFYYQNANYYPEVGDEISPQPGNNIYDDLRNLMPHGSSDDPIVARALYLITGDNKFSLPPQARPASPARGFAEPDQLIPYGTRHGILIANEN